MSKRKQEKIGWIGGWLGGFIWVVILSVVLLLRGFVFQALLGFLIAPIACVAIYLFSPWRYPKTPYRLLMLPVYLLLIIAISWGAWAWGGWRQMGITSWWSALILLPVLMPLWTVGNRRWEDGSHETRERGAS